MAWDSTVPAVLDALGTIWRAAFTDPSIVVSDGEPVGDTASTKVVTVGYNGEGDEAVTGSMALDGDGETNAETYTVNCCVGAYSGGDVYPRADAFDLYATCCEALAADLTLGLEPVMSAIPGDFTVRMIANPNGRTVRIVFGVNIRAFTT